MASDRTVVIASHNPNKFAEIVPLFSGSSWKPILANELGIEVPEVDETGSTFASNAALKAQTFLTATGLPVVADDTGLEVAALNGEPGVHSNRWYPGSYEDRNTALLQRMSNVTNRSAQFITVACVALPGVEPLYFTGIVRGTLGTEPKGSDGFGYDPLFIPEGYAQTFAELGSSVKQTLSHRARAFVQVVEYLESLH